MAKLLTVDDSKTVRIIVKKAFRHYDLEICEAANGVEGLSTAAKEQPDLILLDITMPVMDGVEMLTKLKSDPQLKGIPVIMLTAEGGRDNVLKIAKIGVRDYIIKPFREELLIDKVSRIIELRTLSQGPVKRKSIHDVSTILVLEDKQPIINQLSDGLSHTPWVVKGFANSAPALEFCSRNEVDLALVSLSLPDEEAFKFFREVRAQSKTKALPVFAMVVKTAVEDQAKAQQAGFTSIITKPIDFLDLEAKMARAMNLDTSERYFKSFDDYLLFILPEVLSPGVISDINNCLSTKFADAVDVGLSRIIIDASTVRGINMSIIRLLLRAMQEAQELTLKYALVGNSELVQECKSFEETKDWTFFTSIEDARSAMQ